MIANPARQDFGHADTAEAQAAPGRGAGGRGGYLRFVALLVLAVLLFRSLVFTPFTIPSESMLPNLMRGDYLIAAKWPYGWSRWSLPFDAPLIEGVVAPGLPARGDVAIFRHPVDRSEYVKRVIGLPGDTVALRGGQIVLNGTPVPRAPSAAFRIRVSPNTRCAWGAAQGRDAGGRAECRYARLTETLPGGRQYLVLDFGRTVQDDFGPVTVPAGHLFMLGDNRDNSQDSRFAARAGGGVGMVPADLLVGRAEMVLFSTDGSARWYDPLSWVRAARWIHIGDRL